jgi:iron complex outermembrane recepter protein
MSAPHSYRLALIASTAFFLIAPAARAADAAATATASPAVEEVVVTAVKEQYRGNVPLRELPQSLQTISGTVLANLNITRLDSALDLVAGVSRQNNFGGVWDAFAIRGFAGDENVPSGVLVNGFNEGRGFAGPRDVSGVERIDVLKGPASALFGRGEPGGTVNIVTKKPQFTQQGALSVSAGSFDAYRADGDITGPISDSVAARLNGAYENAHSFRETVKTNKYVITPSVLVGLGADTTVSEELQLVHQEVPFDRGIPAFNGVLGAIPNSRFLGEPGNGPNKIDALSNQIELQHKFNADWTLLTGFGYLKTALKGFGEDPEFAASRDPFFANGQILSRRRISRDYHSTDYVPRAELSGHFETFSMVHHVMLGADYEDFDLDQVQGRYRPPVYTTTTTLAQLNAVNVFNPVYGNLPAVSPFTNKVEKDKTWGVYGQDQIDLTDQWKLRLGVRFDNYRQTLLDRLAVTTAEQSKTATSPTVGLVYEPTSEVSLYANYGTGFRPNTGFSVTGAAFQPELTKSYEVGAKYQSADGALNGTISLFKTQKTNILTSDPANAGFSLAAGSAESRGVEVETYGKLPGDINFNLSYSYLDAFFTTTLLDPDFARPITPGTRLLNIPANSGNLLLSRDFAIMDHVLKLGVDVNYVSRRLGETGTSFYLPSYSLVKLTASYNLTKSIDVYAEVNNLMDKVYYPSSYAALWVNPGAPREYNVRVAYHF